MVLNYAVIVIQVLSLLRQTFYTKRQHKSSGVLADAVVFLRLFHMSIGIFYLKMFNIFKIMSLPVLLSSKFDFIACGWHYMDEKMEIATQKCSAVIRFLLNIHVIRYHFIHLDRSAARLMLPSLRLLHPKHRHTSRRQATQDDIRRHKATQDDTN